MKKFICLLMAVLMSFALVGCGNKGNNDNSGTSDSGSTPTPPPAQTGGEITVPTAENFDFSDAFANTEGWLGLQKKNPVFDTENKFITFREKSNNVITYKTLGMSKGDIELQLKVQINKDTTAYVGFNNQSKNLSEFCYYEGSYMYTLEFSSDSKMYVKKWTNGAESVLSGSKSSASVPLALASKLTAVKISVSENNNAVAIVVYVNGKETLNVTDSDKAYLGGGAITLSYTGAGGMVVGAKNSKEADYVAPEALGLSIYESPNVEKFTTGTLNLLENFEANWTGRERIFNYKKDATGYVFESKDNPEEPQAGITEYQAVYANKIFGNVQMEYTYNQISNGEWTMFWLRCVPENSTDVSIWGNKMTGQNTNGYSMLITFDGYVQIHKWNDGSQIWLNGQGTKLSGPIVAMLNDPNAVINVKMSIEEVEIGGKPTIEFRICVNDATTVVVQDSDTPYLNAGYIGMQGFATNNKVDSIRLLTATVTDTITL